MRRLTTVLCSIAFLLSGVFIAIRNPDISSNSGYKTISAATLPNYQIPQFGNNSVVIPFDLLLDQAKKSVPNDSDNVTTDDLDLMIQDSLKNRIKYLESKKQVTKVKWLKAPAPPPVVKTEVIEKIITDTVHVPVYYLATQVGNKEGPTDKCISIYELQQVDEICPENTNSSTRHVNEHDVK